MKIENWNGHEIRFVEKDGEWWAVFADICNALGIQNTSDSIFNPPKGWVEPIYPPSSWISKSMIAHPQSPKKKLEVLVVNELGIYRIIMRSDKPDAIKLQIWVCNLLKTLREALGYDQWMIKTFTESVIHHHLDMDIIKDAFPAEEEKNFIKSHSITNKVMANLVGEPKAIGKDELKERYPEMLPLRDEVLHSTVQLMSLNEKFHLGLSISEQIYRKYSTVQQVHQEAI